ncbi:hypothetical protein Pan44_49820 [Caulifigura coniformis]|uniref:Uncharacterized protein n=1 Tax=Caulifigura coniformis TaxID=2527983 RepID=A0A517SLA9_9PLAN|nr:hypothetical protein [Caulifigura coniformis]QDT56919.1 hypothetical protein Pan44_49820 [Caulifigura coniformis]
MPEKPRSRAELNSLEAPTPAPKWVRYLAYTVVALFGTTCLTCGYLLYLAKPTVSNDPAYAQFTAENIVTFTPAQGYLPKGAIEWPLLSLLKMRAAYFEKPEVDGMLVLIEVGSDALQGNERVERYLESMLREKNGISDALQVQPLVKKELVKVQGRERQFDLSEALDPVTNVRYRLIEGTVQSILGRPVFIGLRYKLDAESDMTGRLPDDIRKMLESIN